MDDTQDEQRISRAMVAARAGVTAALPELLSLLGDESWRVRGAAVEALVALSNPGVVAPALLQSLREPENAGRRNAALAALTRLGRGAVGVLVDILADPSADVRKLAVDALGILADPAAVAPLERLLADPDANVRAAAVESLGRVGGPAAVRALGTHLHQPPEDPLEASATLLALAASHAPVETGALGPFLADPLLRAAAVGLLPWSPSPDAPDRLADAVASPSPSVCGAAVAAICAAGMGAPAVAALAEEPGRRAALRRAVEGMVPSRDDEVASCAAAVASWVAGEGTARLLLAHRHGRPWDGAIAHALRTTVPAALPSVLSALPALEPEDQALALELVASVGGTSPAAFVPVARLASTASGDLLERACRAMGALDRHQAAHWLAQRLADESLLYDDAETVERALRELAALDAGLARTALHGVATLDERPRLLALLALAAEPGDLPRLRAMARHQDATLRAAACDGLARVGGGPDVAVLRTLLMDEDGNVRSRAATALGRVGGPEDAAALEARASSESGVTLEPVLHALAALAPARVGEVIKARLGSSPPDVLSALLRAAESLGTELALHAGTLAASHQDPDVVRAAARTLGTAADPRAVALLGKLVTDERWVVRHASARALAHQRRSGGLPDDVLRTLRDTRDRETDPLVKEALGEALGDAG